MVLIIDGELVADDDPRAIAKRGGGGGGGGGGGSGGGIGEGRPFQSAYRPNIGGTHQAAQTAPGPTASPLDALAGALGIAGKTVQIPAIAGRVPARDVPLIIVLIIAAVTLFFGWQILAIAALLHVVSGISETGAAPQGRRPQQQPRPGTG